jgi:uncharacterized protein with von Willebrand factor type A (vWA) domain
MAPDRRAILRVTDELLWVLRREGIEIATSQAIDAVRAVKEIGFESREDMREALAAVIVHTRRERSRFDRAFDAFFAREGRPLTFWERLAARGFSEDETRVLRELLDQLAASSAGDALGGLLARGADLDRLLSIAGTTRVLEGMTSPLQAGFYTHRLLDRLGVTGARTRLASLRPSLVDALGSERANELLAVLEAELTAAADDVRSFVRQVHERRENEEGASKAWGDAPLAALSDADALEVRRAIRRFVDRLRGGERLRRRRARRGRIDAHRTLRLALRSGGVPLVLARRARRRDKPKLVIVCDVSESVRNVARFLLELTYAAQELFSGTRTFVFVSELGETTALFAESSVETALSRAYSGGVVPVTGNSNYGRVLRTFEREVLPDLDRRTTVVIVGDGRTNYLEPSAEVLDAIRARARAVIWLCPEPRGGWATGDSAMPRYAPKCTHVLDVRSARDLEDAARLLVTLR